MWQIETRCFKVKRLNAVFENTIIKFSALIKPSFLYLFYLKSSTNFIIWLWAHKHLSIFVLLFEPFCFHLKLFVCSSVKGVWCNFSYDINILYVLERPPRTSSISILHTFLPCFFHHAQLLSLSKFCLWLLVLCPRST